ncbi:hypothetical protein BH23GEM7_BH23GEM7_35610 [soil metagenome]
MIRIVRAVAFLLVAFSAACGGPPPPPPAPPVEPVVAEVPPFSHPYVWTPQASMQIRTETGWAVVPYLFSRLEVLGTDSLGLRVRCSFCPEPVEGWVSREEVIYESPNPHLAAHGELAEFLLAVRDAVMRLDVDRLRPVMVRDFMPALDGPEGAEEALARWQWERYRALDHLPRLLDRGVVSRDGRLWVAPPEFLLDPDYQGIRTGFRRSGDRWEWLFLVGGI